MSEYLKEVESMEARLLSIHFYRSAVDLVPDRVLIKATERASRWIKDIEHMHFKTPQGWTSQLDPYNGVNLSGGYPTWRYSIDAYPRYVDDVMVYFMLTRGMWSRL